MLIERPPRLFRCLVPGGLFRVPLSPGDEKRIYLTFDDGPIPEVTPWVLGVLGPLWCESHILHGR